MIKRFMMKRYISIIVLLVLALGAMAQGKEPMAFTAFFKNGMDKVEGILPVYKGADKYYLEIPMNLLGREMFFFRGRDEGNGDSLRDDGRNGGCRVQGRTGKPGVVVKRDFGRTGFRYDFRDV